MYTLVMYVCFFVRELFVCMISDLSARSARFLHPDVVVVVVVQVEKVSHAVATRLLSSLGEIEKVGASLGSFSMSSLIVDVSGGAPMAWLRLVLSTVLFIHVHMMQLHR